MIQRISKRDSFARFRGVRALRDGQLSMRAVIDPTASGVHLALATPTRMGSAVARNRVRRQVRAAMRERAHLAPAGWYLIAIDGHAVDTTWGQLGISLDTLLQGVRRQAPTPVNSAPRLNIHGAR